MFTRTTTNIDRTSRFDNVPIMTFAPDLTKVSELNTENTAEVQAFLSVRPVHTVVMSSFIADNGIVSELNRGKFYGYRNTAGKLEGVALIGHSTLVEARSDEAPEGSLPHRQKVRNSDPLDHVKRKRCREVLEIPGFRPYNSEIDLHRGFV